MKIRVSKVGETLDVEVVEVDQRLVQQWSARTETELPWADVELRLRLAPGDVVSIERVGK